MNNYLTLEECNDGYLYLGDGRNFDLGVYSKKRNSFVGLRYKFGTWIVDEELHWDSDPNFGTFKPIEELELCEKEVDGTKEMFKWLWESKDKYKGLLID